MLETKTKLEVLENIARSDDVLATEKFCIFSTILPKEIVRDILIHARGMIDMAEMLVKQT